MKPIDFLIAVLSFCVGVIIGVFSKINQPKHKTFYWVYWVLANRFLWYVKMTITDVIYGCAARTQLKKLKK